MPPKVSVIIVNYHSRAYLSRLVASLWAGKYTNFEIIIIDNDRHNVGYGRAVNQGAAHARGQYLFVTNPDTLALPDTLAHLVDFLDTHPQTGLVAPLLLDPRGRPYRLQGTGPLTPLTAIFALSAINKYWPQNPVSRAYWLTDINRGRPFSVSVAPGTAFLVRRAAFIPIGGFDSRFFLYFEESDLCRRLTAASWRIFIHPQARLVHYWGRSTPDSPRIKQIFTASRRLYFTKHFGRLWAYLVDLVVK